MLLTACEKGLVDGVADVVPTGQAANSVLPVLKSESLTASMRRFRLPFPPKTTTCCKR